jgi:hypothetical protein
VAALVLVASVPLTADAQWYAGIYLGASHTHSARVEIAQPDLGRALSFENVAFDGEPFKSPQYYGYRVGRLFGDGRRFGVEFEFIHLKVIARTDRAYTVTGPSAADVGAPVAMNAVVQRYAMTHGLNFAVVNLVSRVPMGGGPVTVVLRSGLGPTIPHAESTVEGDEREQYEPGGLGAHVAAGIEVGTWRRVSATGEYKFTFVRPEIDIPHGTGRTTAATHQVAFGLAFALGR